MEAKKSYPFGFWVCCLSFSFERLAYYSAKWGIAIFVAMEAAKGGLGLTSADGALMNSNLVAFTYITPVIGGFIADRWISPRLLVPIGEILMGLGYLCLWKANGLGMVWAAIILVSIGTGGFKGNVSGVNGRILGNVDEAALNAAFNIQYMFVNIGSFCGTTFLSLVAYATSFRLMFLVCGLFLFLDCAWWLFGMKSFGEAGKKPFLHDNPNASKEEEAKDNAPLTALEKRRVAAILIVTLFSGIFWLIWYMVYMPVYYEFGPEAEAGLGWAKWSIGSFNIPTAWFDSANALFCIILCPIFAKIWLKMAARPQGDWGMFKKTAIGIILLGCCTASMVIAAIMCGQGTKDPVGVWVLIITAALMTIGEVIFSPLGNAFINKYAPKKLLGTLLGVWPLIIFFSGKGYGPLYNWLENFDFVKAYGAVTIIIIACGLVMLVFNKKFDALVEG